MIDDLIDRYQLKPHPEGGYYREVYRSGQTVISPIHGNERSAATHIYFLLAAGQVSRFHAVAHDEIWNFYEGSSLRLVQHDGESTSETLLGPDSHMLSVTVKGSIFQAAESTGDYSLVGCTVAPGFDFEDFSFLDQDAASVITDRWPDYSRFL